MDSCGVLRTVPSWFWADLGLFVAILGGREGLFVAVCSDFCGESVVQCSIFVGFVWRFAGVGCQASPLLFGWRREFVCFVGDSLAIHTNLLNWLGLEVKFVFSKGVTGWGVAFLGGGLVLPDEPAARGVGTSCLVIRFASLLPIVGIDDCADHREGCAKRLHTTKWSPPAQGALSLRRGGWRPVRGWWPGRRRGSRGRCRRLRRGRDGRRLCRLPWRLIGRRAFRPGVWW